MATKDEERAERLAAALRENLKRRKAQARANTPSQKARPEALSRWEGEGGAGRCGPQAEGVVCREDGHKLAGRRADDR